MKRYFRYVPVTMLMALAGCSQDELLPQGDGNVNITVNLPSSSYGTRAFSDGYAATDLQYAVYDAANKNMITEGSATFDADKRSTTVSINLATGKSYQIAFFAHRKSQSVYTFNADSKTIDVNYSAMTEYNSEDYDCFYKLEDVENVEKGVNKDVTLVRPVAQVNWGTGDLSYPAVLDADAYGAGAGRLVSSVKAKGYTQFDMMTGDVVEGTETEVTFGDKARPAETELFPVEPGKYKYVSMQYLLIPKGGTLIDVTLEARNSAGAPALATVNVANAPVQANYRTNIYGDLLTTPTVFTVTKDEKWGGENDVPLNAETIVDGVKYDKLSQNIFIENLNGLTWLRDQSIGATPNNFQGKTIKLVADIDMSTVANWTPISYLPGGDIQLHFKGEFDGCGHTISNMTSTADEGAGLFYNSWGVIKNLTLKNVNVSAYRDAAGIVGWGHLSHVENCHVIGGTIEAKTRLVDGKMDDGNNCGGIAGYLASNNTAYIKNCTVTGVKLKAYRKVGGVVGYANVNPRESTEVSGNRVNNCEIVADMTVKNYNGVKQPEAGEIYGGAQNGVVLDNNIGKDNSVLVLRLDKTTEVASAKSFVALVEMLNADNNKFAGMTINITADLDFAGVEIPSVTYWNPENYLTIDGNNNTISNITFTKNSPCIFKSLTGNIRNLKINNIRGNTDDRGVGIVANLYGNVENVHVTNADIVSSEGRVGTIVGLHNGGRMINCSAKNVRLVGSWSVGGLSGAINEDALGYRNCTVENVEVKFSGSGFGGIYDKLFGVMCGNVNKYVEFEDCKIINCGDHTLPVDYTDAAYKWNGVLIPADE